MTKMKRIEIRNPAASSKKEESKASEAKRKLLA